MHIFLLRENRAKTTDYIWRQGFVVEQNRSVLKQLRSFTALIFDDNLFQRLWADAVNDLSPNVSTKICCALPLAFNCV